MCPVCVNQNFCRLPAIHIKMHFHQPAVSLLPHLTFLTHSIQIPDLLKIFSKYVLFVCMFALFFVFPLLHIHLITWKNLVLSLEMKQKQVTHSSIVFKYLCRRVLFSFTSQYDPFFYNIELNILSCKHIFPLSFTKFMLPMVLD